MEPRTVSNVPIFLNGLAKALLIIDNRLAWKIGNGNKVLLGVDPKVGVQFVIIFQIILSKA